MEKIKLETYIEVYSLGELSKVELSLVEAVNSAAKKAYAPYSGFQVGAAVLLENGEIVTGNNQENAAYPSGLCAERVALFYAGAQYPDVAILKIAVSAFAGDKQIEKPSPCGSCRQVLLESETRGGKPVEILLCGKENVYKITGVSSLLPVGFNGADLPK